MISVYSISFSWNPKITRYQLICIDMLRWKCTTKYVTIKKSFLLLSLFVAWILLRFLLSVIKCLKIKVSHMPFVILNWNLYIRTFTALVLWKGLVHTFAFPSRSQISKLWQAKKTFVESRSRLFKDHKFQWR